MRYEFRLVGGKEVIEKDYPMRNAPPLGTIITIDGRKFERIASGSVEGRDNTNSKKYPCEDLSLPRDTVTAGGKGRRGFPVFNSQAEHKEFGKRHGFGWD